MSIELQQRKVGRVLLMRHILCFHCPEAPMSVKDVLQSLVDDNMVDSERVGTSNYYWAFPSKALHARKRKLQDLEKQVTEIPLQSSI